MSYTIINDNNITHLKTLEDNSIDSIITDPPYGIEFLGKDWDTNTGAVETWQQCLRVLKPGGYLLAFSAARTYHHLATNIESVGFEIRDQLMWLYASGFPKAQDIGKAIDKRAGKYDINYGTTTTQTQERGINTHGAKGMGSRRCNRCQKDVAHQYECNDTQCGMKYNYGSEEAKQWAGWKTALKPSHEPIVMARKPFKGSTMDNVLQHGVGALNIDATRIAYTDNMATAKSKIVESKCSGGYGYENKLGYKETYYVVNDKGRFPSNVLGEVEGYQKYFYCPKVSRRERHTGFEQTDLGRQNYNDGWHCEDANRKKDPLAHIDVVNQGGNNHPTVKPVELMKYLIKLVTPPNSTVLDPFCGSGSTGMAAVELGHTFTGIELDADYVEIAKRRIEGWNRPKETGNTYNELFEEHDA
tara:strand:+ start:793 stop:2037 length:1245 start_codon:yes stop_codon:yes gene_type:complete